MIHNALINSRANYSPSSDLMRYLAILCVTLHIVFFKSNSNSSKTNTPIPTHSLHDSWSLSRLILKDREKGKYCRINELDDLQDLFQL